MPHFRSSLLGVLLVSSVLASACGPQTEADTEEAVTTTQAALKDSERRQCNQPNRVYVSRDPVQCLAITFDCGEDGRQFFDDCGCGCKVKP